jgi:hypothetical protein
MASSRTDGNSVGSVSVGTGWQLPMDYIERDARFTPGNTSDDTYKLHFKGAVYDLVFVPSENRFHTKTESFLKIERLPGAGNEKGDYWKVTTPDGTWYRFGADFATDLMCGGHDYVQMWALDLVHDTHNNEVYYEYADTNGVLYLTNIRYNNTKQKVVAFMYGQNPYQKQIYSHGCLIIEGSWLLSIHVKIGITLVRQYDLAYHTAGNNQPLLHTIMVKGSDGSALPATTFAYNPHINTWASQFTAWTSSLDANLETAQVRVVDVTGDGLADVIFSSNVSAITSQWRVFTDP